MLFFCQEDLWALCRKFASLGLLGPQLPQDTLFFVALPACGELAMFLHFSAGKAAWVWGSHYTCDSFGALCCTLEVREPSVGLLLGRYQCSHAGYLGETRIVWEGRLVGSVTGCQGQACFLWTRICLAPSFLSVFLLSFLFLTLPQKKAPFTQTFPWRSSSRYSVDKQPPAVCSRLRLSL